MVTNLRKHMLVQKVYSLTLKWYNVKSADLELKPLHIKNGPEQNTVINLCKLQLEEDHPPLLLKDPLKINSKLNYKYISSNLLFKVIESSDYALNKCILFSNRCDSVKRLKH